MFLEFQPQYHKAELRWTDVELRERSIAEKHILENVLIFVFTVDILLGIMGLFLILREQVGGI